MSEVKSRIETLKGFLKCHKDNLARVEAEFKTDQIALVSIKESIARLEKQIKELEG